MAAPDIWDKGPYEGAATERRVLSRLQGTLALRAYQEAERLSEGRGKPVEYLRGHRREMVAALLSWAVEHAPQDDTPQLLLERDATEEGLADISRFLREAVAADHRRFGWLHLSLCGPFHAALAMQEAQPGAAVSLIVAPHSDAAGNVDQHVWRPRAVAASRNASALVLVVGNRNKPYTFQCLDAALPRCAEESAHRTHVTLVNATDMVPSGAGVWTQQMKSELLGRVTAYRASTAMAQAQRATLDELQIRTVIVHRARFLAQLVAAEGSPMGRAALQLSAAADTGATEVLGFLTSAALEAEVDLVRDLEGRAARQRAACMQLQTFDDVALTQLTAFTVAARHADGKPRKASPEVQNIRDTLQRNHAEGLASRARNALDAVWGATANAAALARAKEVAAAQRAALNASPDMTVSEALKPLKEWFLEHAHAQWQKLVRMLVDINVAAMVPTCQVPPAAAEALALEGRALLDGTAKYGRACVNDRLLQAHAATASPFLRTPKLQLKLGSTPIVNEEKLARMERSLTTGSSAIRAPPSRVDVFDELCEHLQAQFALALGTHASEAKQVFEPVVVDVLEATFQAAHAQRGASILAAEARRTCDTSVNAFMERQLTDFAALCEQFRQQRPAREKFKGWALLRQLARWRPLPPPASSAGGSGGDAQGPPAKRARKSSKGGQSQGPT